VESYVVRVWAPAEAEATPGLHGTAVHLRSGERITFSDSAALLSFLAAGSRDPAATHDHGEEPLGGSSQS
jgi:hypothetical protein